MQHKGATGEKKTFSTPETDLRIKFYKKSKTLRENVILTNSNSFLDFYRVYILWQLSMQSGPVQMW